MYILPSPHFWPVGFTGYVFVTCIEEIFKLTIKSSTSLQISIIVFHTVVKFWDSGILVDYLLDVKRCIVISIS